MQLGSRHFNAERAICSELLECVQQPLEFRGVSEWIWLCGLICRIPISKVTLNTVSKELTSCLVQNVQELLPPRVVDRLMTSIYKKELERCSKRLGVGVCGEEVSPVRLCL